MEINPSAAWMTYLGTVYKESGRRAKAERLWKDVLERNPGYAPAERELRKLNGTTE